MGHGTQMMTSSGPVRIADNRHAAAAPGVCLLWWRGGGGGVASEKPTLLVLEMPRYDEELASAIDRIERERKELLIHAPDQHPLETPEHYW